MKNKNTNSDTIRIKKHLGQNFLSDQNILSKIVAAAEIDPETYVIEIGPGTGALTEKLLKAKKVLAYEIDKELIPGLTKRFSHSGNLTILNQDILSVDIDQDIEKHFGPKTRAIVVANLPYYITTPILMKFLETSKLVDKMILMMQMEVARRLTSKPNTKDYNALSVAISYRSSAEYLFKVPRTVFYPQPNVDSAVVSIKTRYSKPLMPNNESFFFVMVRNCFQQRRKTLANNLLSAYPKFERNQLETILSESKIDAKARAETLSLEDFIRLSDVLEKFV
ncbi:MAG: 16S rRNA (adenine(1518)-N(6)/adenine(1519)-N(6))-dimethyltransferase RsmA [Bacilli bacterium]|nr:16S rRNA (adenine(1518)-N(6)/adenine(1519)-N(6))-dimethyltransferase RsmA [Bacilli bacterium]MBN2696269.1 16S rRNA (adenine(1518)-N(6)/adenine(1519)-N(6))-dimethyltransferase RsmA [Bacilli bacterium]